MTNKSEIDKNTLDDVAKTLADILKYQNTKRKIIKMRAGETPIDEALSQI